MKKFINKITDIAEDLDCSVNVNGNELEFSKYSPAGQDFNFCITADSLEEAVEKMNEYCYNFDCSEETALWLDDTGHGTNGAPYDMKDLYKDMEACEQMMEELRDKIQSI